MALAAPVQAATPKAGAKCSKAGTTATAAGKKFTCVKSGKKLVWNKGVRIKSAPKPTPTPSATPTPETKVEVKDLLASDSRITPVSALTTLETCKTEDMTPGARRRAASGPRPADARATSRHRVQLVRPARAPRGPWPRCDRFLLPARDFEDSCGRAMLAQAPGHGLPRLHSSSATPPLPPR